MENMYRKHLFKCSYKVLREEAEQHFENTDPRIIEGYIGRPAELKRYPGYDVVRMNRQEGKVARFNYMNTRKIEAKQGLAQRLGLITIEGDKYVLHHELLSYFTSQSELPKSPSEIKESSESNDKLCVCPIEDSHKGKGEGGKPICEGVPPTNVEGGEGGREEREI